ncbi:MAG: DUF4397 domain-containing protein [Acidimicrobiales bacterium]|jgi:hypothetical protein|nr:DUF4397 domain-containing protein [Acidimicrobiales bacterium]
MRPITKKLVATAALAGLGLGVAPAAVATASASTPPPSQVYVTHGLPLDNAGTKVDVYAGAAGAGTAGAGLLIDDFLFGQTVGPVALPAANYSVYLAAPTADDDGVLSDAEVIYNQDLAVPSGQNLSVVASFNASAAPQLAVFSNNVSKTNWFTGRVSVRHAAAAPAVKVDVGIFPWARYFPGLVKTVGPAVNGQQADLNLLSARYDVKVKLASNNAFVAGVDKFAVPSRTLTNVYAVGNPANGTFQFITSSIKL